MHFNHKPEFSFRVCLVLIFLLTACSLLVSNSSIIYADDEKESEEISQKIKELEIVTIENTGYKKDRKGPAEFEHVKHAREYKISCWECHHEFKDDQENEQPAAAVQNEQSVETAQNEETEQGEQPVPIHLTEQNIWSPWGKSKKCSECHDPKEKKDDVIMLQAAYHRNCKNCHMERRIFKNDILAYRKCTGCHK